MSSSAAAGSSASGSLPQNLGVGFNSQSVNEAAGKIVNLSRTAKDALEMNLTTVRKLYSDTTPPSPQELETLSQYTTSLIEDCNKDDVVEALKGKIKGVNLTDMDRGVNSYIFFIAKMRKSHVEVGIIDKKFKAGSKMDYKDCFLIDELPAIAPFAEKMRNAKVTDNKHINCVFNVHSIAEANAFKEFKDGDVLFYDVYGASEYRGQGMGFFEKLSVATMVSALGTQYSHVGIFYRDPQGKPCVAQIQGHFFRTRLTFGQQSYIKGKRIDPSKFTAKKLTAQEKLEAQAKIGGIFANIIAGKNWKLGITMGQQLGCVMSHSTSLPETVLGNAQIHIKDKTNVLCSEFAGRGLMEAFHTYNQDKLTTAKLSSPFNPFEDMENLHPERLLVGFGPDQGTAQANSGWEDVKPLTGAGVLPLAKMLPIAPAFPDLSYPKAA